MSKIIISTESGSDLPYKIYEPYNIHIVPLHVMFGNDSMNDGAFSIDNIFRYYNEHKALPTTSAVNPPEYINHFKSIFNNNPDCKIIHIAYSSKLSATYQNALIAANEFAPDKICVIDSLNASAGAGVLAMLSAQLVKKCGDSISLNEYASIIKQYAKRICVSLVPQSLDYLRAGGRISGAAHISASVLGIKPSVNVIDGYIESGKKYRGNINQIAHKYLEDFVNANNIERDFLVIIYSHGLSKSLLFALKRQAHKMNFRKSWCFQAGSAVSCHIGPSALGFAGISKK